MYNLGLTIKLAREESGLSQMDMAKEIPMNQSNYSKIERGIQEPNIEQLKRICEILKLDSNYLLDIDNIATSKPNQLISTEDLNLLNDIKALIKKYK